MWLNLISLNYLFSYDFLNNTSRILFIEIVTILKKTKNNSSQPTIIAKDSNIEPKSRSIKLCIRNQIIKSYSTFEKLTFLKSKRMIS